MKTELLWFKVAGVVYEDPPLPEGSVEPHLQAPGVARALSAHKHGAP